jgi:Protein of unknown function (DUF3047)
MGRRLFDPELPAASICYQRDAQLAAGTWLPNAYTARVQMLVLGDGATGSWSEERRDLAADFARAFPHEARGGTPTLAAIGVAGDGDNTGADSLAYVADIRLQARP